MKFVDVHAHLNDEAYRDDLEQVVERINQEMFACICGGYDEASSKSAVEFAKRYDKIFATVGIHPENVEYFFDDSIDVDEKKVLKLTNLAKSQKVVGIGEIGLDYHYLSGKTEEEIAKTKQKQKLAFIAQIKLANALDLPIVVHCRDAMSDCLKILEQNKPNKESLMHCYSGTIEEAKKLIDLGFAFSFGGVTTFKNAKNVQEVVKSLPMEKILLETDCPYLCPEPYRGKRNEPVFAKYVADKIASLRGISMQEVVDKTTENACRIFGLEQ